MASPTSLMNVSPLSVLREGKADGYTNKLDERWTLLTLSPLLVLRERKADGFTNKLDDLRPCWCCAKEKRMASPTSLMNVGHFALVGVARRKSGWFHQQA
jgi:hypothetical protein